MRRDIAPWSLACLRFCLRGFVHSPQKWQALNLTFREGNLRVRGREPHSPFFRKNIGHRFRNDRARSRSSSEGKSPRRFAAGRRGYSFDFWMSRFKRARRQAQSLRRPLRLPATAPPFPRQAPPDGSDRKFQPVGFVARQQPRNRGSALFVRVALGLLTRLAPGHGKTLVAAYLVGERGTAWHAVILGLVTTITHTGAVIALGGGTWCSFSPRPFPATCKCCWASSAGYWITRMGGGLLLRRLGGGADHFHVGGGHHHPHEPAKMTDDKKVGWFGLVILGISGGIVPCWDAILEVLGFAISAQRVWLALPLLLAFSMFAIWLAFWS